VPDEINPDGLPSGVEVVALPAETDVANADMVLAALSAVFRRGVPIVIADMSGTVFCDCAGVAALVTARHRAGQCGAELRVVAVTEQVLRLFGIFGLAELINIHPSVSAAAGRGDAAERAFPADQPG
jgi:anti-sigma B factor antagonist